MDQIQAMRVFARVVESGTFTLAATSLQLPKASVTKHVQALEDRLRVKLLNRTTRRVTVTTDGAAYYDRAVRLLSDFDELEASMSQVRATPRGRLRVDVGTSIARLLVIPQLATFQARYPDIQIDLGVTDRTVDLIADNVDCVVRGGELRDQSLVARRVGNVEFLTVASPAYLQRQGTPQHPRDLENIEIANPSTLAVNEANAYTTCLLSGQGVGQITSYQARDYLQSGQLVQILPEWTQPLLPVYVVYPPNSHLSAKVRAFVDWVVEIFAADPLLQCK